MPSEAQARALVDNFPATFETAVADWAKFKAGVAGGLVSPTVRNTVVAWYQDFPKLWLALSPNWTEALHGVQPSAEKLAFAERVSRWIVRLRGEPDFMPQLGQVQFLVIAGIAILAAFGAAGVTWAIGYASKQKGISAIIDGVVAGKLPVEVLNKALEEEKQAAGGGLFGGLTALLKSASGLVLLGLTAALFWPALRKGFGGARGR